MGTLKPGATYVYERDNGTVYAREMGSNPSTRKAVGWDYQTSGNAELNAHNEWIRIRLEAKTNPALQKAVDRVIMIYKLSKDKIE